jgi:hypothetical protein
LSSLCRDIRIRKSLHGGEPRVKLEAKTYKLRDVK